MSHGLTNDQLEEYKEAFDVFDRDADGKITTDELGVVMRSLGHNPTENELQEMINEVDVNRNGTLEFSEFLGMMSRHNLEESIGVSETVMREAFRQFDADGNGVITADELRMAMSEMGEAMNKEDIEEMIAEADLNGDGVVDYEEFILMMGSK